MNAQCAASSLHQYLEVAAGLRSLHDTEAVRMAWHIDISRIIAGDLQEHTGIRSTLVSLPGRMLEAGSEPDAGGGVRPVAKASAHCSQRLRVPLIAFDISEQCDVIA